MKRETIEAVAECMDDGLMLLDDLDDAFIGVTRRCGESTVAVYSWERIAEILVERDGMDYDEAAEFIDYNILGAWMGEQTPMILIGMSDKEEEDAVTALEEQVQSLGVLVDALKRLQDTLLDDLDAWMMSCPKILRRWMIARVERKRRQIRI